MHQSAPVFEKMSKKPLVLGTVHLISWGWGGAWIFFFEKNSLLCFWLKNNLFQWHCDKKIICLQ